LGKYGERNINKLLSWCGVGKIGELIYKDGIIKDFVRKVFML